MSGGPILITGAGGYLGLRLARDLLANTDHVLILWLRDDGLRKSQAPIHALADNKRVRITGGDLSQEDPFAVLDPREITGIVHAAAVTRFNVDPETAQRINVEGTRKLLDFAERCPALEFFDLLSTIYVAGLRTGTVREELLDESAGFANEYERSKSRAEQLLAGRLSLPWRIFRIATVISDDDRGHVVQQNAVHNTLKLLYYGLLSLIPGTPEVPLYFVTGEFVTTALRTMMTSSVPSGTIVHISHSRSESVTLEQFIAAVFDTFQLDATFRSRRALRPLYANAESFDLLAAQVSRLSSGILGQAVGSMAPFARQLFSTKDFSNDNLRAFIPSYTPPDPVALIVRTCENLLATRFGMNQQTVTVSS